MNQINIIRFFINSSFIIGLWRTSIPNIKEAKFLSTYFFWSGPPLTNFMNVKTVHALLFI
jgi:hypothetical protein